MGLSSQLVVFALDGQPYALELAKVHRVVRAMEVTPLPNAPDVILGVVNMQGELIPVVNLRHRFRLPNRDIRASDQFIIANMTNHSGTRSQEPTRSVVLVVDSVAGIELIATENIVEGRIVADLEFVQGVAKVTDGLIVIYDLERCLSLDEEKLLDNALAKLES